MAWCVPRPRVLSTKYVYVPRTERPYSRWPEASSGGSSRPLFLWLRTARGTRARRQWGRGTHPGITAPRGTRLAAQGDPKARGGRDRRPREITPSKRRAWDPAIPLLAAVARAPAAASAAGEIPSPPEAPRAGYRRSPRSGEGGVAAMGRVSAPAVTLPLRPAGRCRLTLASALTARPARSEVRATLRPRTLRRPSFAPLHHETAFKCAIPSLVVGVGASRLLRGLELSVLRNARGWRRDWFTTGERHTPDLSKNGLKGVKNMLFYVIYAILHYAMNARGKAVRSARAGVSVSERFTGIGKGDSLSAWNVVRGICSTVRRRAWPV